MFRQGVSRKIKALTAQYVALLNGRQMSEAEKVLEKIKDGLKSKEWHEGYYNALEGIYVASKSKDDRFVFITRINLADKKKLNKLQKEFYKQSRSSLHTDFDKGYLTAWLEYVRALNI